MNLLIMISLSRELTDKKDWEYPTEVTVKSQTPWESTSDSGTSVSKGGPGGGVYLWPGIAVGRLAVSIGCDVSSTSSEDKQTDSGKTERCHCVFSVQERVNLIKLPILAEKQVFLFLEFLVSFIKKNVWKGLALILPWYTV